MSSAPGHEKSLATGAPLTTDAPLYDRIGLGYRATRGADRRIVDGLLALLALDEGAVACELGAGSGNYANALAEAGLEVLAVEPSSAMRQQASAHPGVRWLEGVAEQLPLSNARVDGIVSVLALHHFADLSAALREMQRVCPVGPWVFFTLDPRLGEPGWIYDYFPDVKARELAMFPELGALASQFARDAGRIATIDPFQLPYDLTDQFLHTAWARPERCLDPVFRQNNSGFSTTDQSTVAEGVARLREELRSGVWDSKYGALRSRSQFDAGFRFLTLTPLN